MKYINFRKGLVSKPNLIPISSNPYDHIDDQSKDYYVSLFQYDEHHKDILKEKGTLAGIKDVQTDILYFDFDSKDDIELARGDTLELCNRLQLKGINEYTICFSGCKGFSVEVYSNELLNVDEFKATINSLAGDLKTFDTSVSDPQRIVRLPNTRHQKTPFFKVPLTRFDLETMHVEEIQHVAGKQNFDGYSPVYVDLPKGIKQSVVPKTETKEAVKTLDMSGFDIKSRPAQFDEARWLINNGFFESGERSNALLCLASFYKSLGYLEEQTYRILKGTAELQSKRSGDDRFPDNELYNNIIVQVYGANWKGGIYSIHDENSWLYKYATKKGLNLKDSVMDKPSKILDIQKQFTDFVNNIDKNTIKTGIKRLDDSLQITTGMCLGLVGAPSSGKTAIALDILANTSKQGVTSVFASLDMYRTRIFEKINYRVSGGKSREEIYKMYQSGREKELTKKIDEEFGNVYFYDRSSPTVQNIRDYVLHVEQTSGEKVKLVLIDYFERVSSDMNDDTAASKRVSAELQDMMNDLNVCVIILYQPNKMSIGGGPDTPILNYTAIKGSSFVFQSLRNIISIWRPFQTPHTKDIDKYMSLAILKSDLGELDVFDFGWVGKTGKIYELEDHERQELRDLLKQKEAMKKEKENGGWN